MLFIVFPRMCFKRCCNLIDDVKPGAYWPVLPGDLVMSQDLCAGTLGRAGLSVSMYYYYYFKFNI